MSGNNEDVSLRDEIASAFASDNAKSDEVDNSSVIDKLEEKEETPAKEQPRAEDGKFTKKEPDDAEATQAEAKTEVEPKEEPSVKLSSEKAPSSWSPKIREKWAELPEDVREEIIRREEASAMGVRKLQDEYAPIRSFVEGISPFIEDAYRMGQNPAQFIGNVLSAEQSLRHPDPNHRFQALLNIADQYGIPLRDAINQQAGREVLPPAQQPQIPAAIMQELQSTRQWREQQTYNSLQAEVDNFKVGKEFFEDVRDTMADLMESGVAANLTEAYEKACWANPDVRSVLISREQGQQRNENLKQRQAAAAGATVKSSGQADVQVDADDDDSIEAAVRKAMKENSGRV